MPVVSWTLLASVKSVSCVYRATVEVYTAHNVNRKRTPTYRVVRCDFIAEIINNGCSTGDIHGH